MQARKKDILLVSGEFFGMDELNHSIAKAYNEYIIINYNQKKLWVHIFSSSHREIHKMKKLCYTNNERLNYILCPAFLLLNMVVIYAQIVKYAIKFSPKIIIVDGYILPILISPLKLLHLTKNTVYITGDWHPMNKNKKRILGYIANQYIFPYFDYFSCRCSTGVLNYADRIREARFSYWGKDICAQQRSIVFPLTLRADTVKMQSVRQNNICFLGLLKFDCGLDIAIKSLKKLREHGDFAISVIGPFSHSYLKFKKLAESYNVNDYVRFYGFLERERFKDIFVDCFCGISLIKTKNSYTSFTYQGKIGDYIQYLLAPIASPYIGYMHEPIKIKRLGRIINANEDEFVEAAIDVFKNQEMYKKNLIQYIDSIPGLDIDRLIDFSASATSKNTTLHLCKS